MLKNSLRKLTSTPWLPILALACVPAVSSWADTAEFNTTSITGDFTKITKLKGSPSLTGNAVNPQIKRKGSNYQVKSDLEVNNVGEGKAKDVSVTIYLSDDAVLDDKDTKLKTLSLSDYKEDGSGKVKAGKGVILPFKQKVSAVLAQAVNGKYLIAVLESSNQASTSAVSVAPSFSLTSMPIGNLISLPVTLTAPTTITADTTGTTLQPVTTPIILPTLPPIGTTFPTVTVKGNQIIIGPIVLPE